MAVVIGKGSFRGFADSSSSTDNTLKECSPEQNISNNLQKISRNIQQLKKLVEGLGTSLDSRDLRDKLSAIQSETNQLTKDTNLAIKQYGDDSGADASQLKEKKLQHRRFKETFHDILKEYSEQQKVIRTKERDFIRISLKKSGCFDIDVDERGSFYKDGEQIQVETIQAEIDLDLIKEREQALKQLEQDICDINDIFKDLAGMIEEQGEDIARVEEVMEEVALNVETAVEELQEAEKNVKASRRKMIFLIVILVAIILIILTIVLAIALS